MSDFPIALNEWTAWLSSRAQGLEALGITFAGIREDEIHLPSAAADFDAKNSIGRIAVWVSGEIDFEVLRVTDGKMVFFRHEQLSNTTDPILNTAFAEFTASMTLAPELMASL